MGRSCLWVVCLCILVAEVSSQTGTSTEKSVSTTPEQKELSSLKKPADFRLPTAIKPLHYFIRLQPFVNGNFSIHGYIEITFEVVTPTSDVILHIKDILTKNETLKIYSFDDVNKTSIHVVNQTYDHEKEFYEISLLETLKEAHKFVMQLHFVGYLNDKLNGFYRSSYTGIDGTKRWLGATQFQALHARKAFPCFDEPAMRAEFTIELIREEGMTAISNMPRIDTIPEPTQNGWFIDKFDKSVKMSTYLVAFLISDLKNVSLKLPNDTRELRAWARESAINQTGYALQNAKDILLFYEDYFNISYPLPKMDLVALPDFNAGAMENWGLLAYRETVLLYDPQQSSIFDKFTVGSYNAHELAHMWFGNLVTFKWWSGAWLSEGFATYLTVLSHDNVEPSFKVIEEFNGDDLQRGLTEDAFENSHPVSMQIVHPEEIEDQLSVIIYMKGASLVRMMSFFLGEATFKKGMTRYLNEFAYSAAEQDDLWQSLSLQAVEDEALPSNVTVKQIMDSWTLQKGFPVIHVNLHGNGSASLTQERFLFHKSENASDLRDYKWWVPITYTSESAPDFSQTYPQEWMAPTETTKTLHGMPLDDQWVLFNVLQTGFYRVNYDLQNWKRILRQLNENHTAIHLLNRVQLVGDALQLARAGVISYSIPLAMLPYLKKETQYLPVFVSVREYGYLNEIFKYSDQYEIFKLVSLIMLIPRYDKIGFEGHRDDSYHVQRSRLLILPNICKLQYKPCIDNAVRLYQTWMRNPQNRSTISPSIRKVVYCTAIEAGGNEEWEFAWDYYLTTNLASERSDILSALGCTRNSTIKEHLMKLAFKVDGPIRKQDAAQAFTSLIRDKESSVMAWNYLQQNWNHVHNYVQNKRREIGIIERATRHISTYGELAQVDEFLASQKDLHIGGDRNMKQMREKILVKIKWVDNNLNFVVQWITKNGAKLLANQLID